MEGFWSVVTKRPKVQEVKDGECGEVKWCEANWREGKESAVKWSEVKWSEVKWNEVKWSEMKWSEVKWLCGVKCVYYHWFILT